MKRGVGMKGRLFADAGRSTRGRLGTGPGGERPAETTATAMPFGAGVRHCIGRHLTEYLCTHFLGAVLRDFELIPVHDVVVSFSATVSVTPSPVPVRLVPRPARASGSDPLPFVSVDEALSLLGRDPEHRDQRYRGAAGSCHNPLRPGVSSPYCCAGQFPTALHRTGGKKQP